MKKTFGRVVECGAIREGRWLPLTTEGNGRKRQRGFLCLLLITLAATTGAQTVPALGVSDPSGEPVRMNQVIVNGYRENYVAGDNYSATRTNAPLMTLPLSTGEVTHMLLEDQNVLNMNDALHNVSGVATEFGGPHPLIVNIRGFRASIFRDGNRLGGNNNLSQGGDDLPIDAIAVDRIEILKGPSTILYGRGEPGGIVNFISKRPQPTPEYSLEAMAGSFEQYRAGASLTGPILADKSVLYRFDGSYGKGNSYRDHVSTETYYARPSLEFRLLPQTKVFVSGEFTQSDFTPDHGVLMLPSMSSTGVLSAKLAPVATRSYYFGGNSDFTKVRQQRGLAEIEHEVTPDWTLRAGVNYVHVKEKSDFELDWFYTYNGAMPLGAPPGMLPSNWLVRLHETLAAERTDFGGRIESAWRLRHDLAGASVTHGVLAVADFLRIDTNFGLDINPNQLLEPNSGMIVPLPYPVYLRQENHSISRDTGYSLQDLITIGSQWHILAGGRFERNTVDVTQLAVYTTTPTSTSNAYSGFVPRLGALYQVNDRLSVYASYMGSYQSPGADYGLWDIPSDLKPERAYQTEAGMKLELLDKRVLFTAAAFSIDKYDVIASMPNAPGVLPSVIYYNIGKERASGVEMDVVGQVNKNLRLTMSLNSQTMKFTNPKRLIIDGKRRYGTPTYSGNAWALYEFSNGVLKGLGLGGGATFKSSVFANDADEAELPGYTTLDAVVYYSVSRLRFQVNAYNLANKLAYVASNNGGFGNPTTPFLVMPIAPFRIMASVRYKF